MILPREILLLGLMICLAHSVESLDNPPSDDAEQNVDETKTKLISPAPIPGQGTQPSTHKSGQQGSSLPTPTLDHAEGLPPDSKEMEDASKELEKDNHHGNHTVEAEHDNDHDNDHDNEHDKDDKHDDDKHDEDKNDDHNKKKDHGHSWGYKGEYSPENWALINEKCASTQNRQSPIDIKTEKSKFLSTLDEVSLIRPEDEPPLASSVKNNGHSVAFTIPFSLRVRGGDLGGSFQAAQLHFHWGETSKTGSEHTIDNTPFPLELHIVTYNEEKYDTLMDAVHGDNSLAVLGILFQISEDDNPALQPLVSMLEQVQEPGVEAKMDSLDVESLLPSNTHHYYRYEGSLTTPPCAESVIWTVFRHTVNVSEKQVAEFRELYEKSHSPDEKPGKLAYNWRPVQPLHARLIYRSFPLPSNSVDQLPYERAIEIQKNLIKDKPDELMDNRPSAGPKYASRGNGAPQGGIYCNSSKSLLIGLVISSSMLLR